jgi:uncharacterized membrane protein
LDVLKILRRRPPEGADVSTDTAPAASRIDAVDIARGVALLAMAVYHGSWDLANVRLVDWGVATDPLWRGFAMSIASSFLLIAGVSMHLSERRGFDPERYLWRIGRLAGAALLVSIGTYVVFPGAWVFFGILHMMLVGALLAPLLVRLPWGLALVLAAVALGLPHVARSPAFDGLPLAVTGLSAETPVSNDFVPVFPWVAPLLLGVAIGPWLTARLTRTPASGPVGRGLARLGRWSLVFYLVHQPVLYALATGLAWVLPVDPAVERSLFLNDCVRECSSIGAAEATCTVFCGCVATSLDGTPIWRSRTIDPDLEGLITAAAGSCRQAPGAFGDPSVEPPSDDDD